ncbi:MAG: formyltransferase family protein [Chitinophagaceae bacterium]
MELNKQKHLKILFIGKADDFFSLQAADYILVHYPSAKIIFSARQQPFPKELLNWNGDLIISYLSQWIIPKILLQKVTIAALNFHPGTPEYPGIGCTNFAVYNQVDEFGVTCHHMLPKVDTGEIVKVKRFPVYDTDTVYSITQRCYSHILEMLYYIFSLLMNSEILPTSNEVWKRKPYLRKELDELCRLTPDMDIKEIELRIKATNYLQPWAFMQVGDEIFKLSDEDLKIKSYLAYLSQPNLS